MTAIAEQVLAADPRCSCWVLASAGSGKTKVLIDRLARLLIAGAEPASIVCITYTNAAANEIRQRLQRTLALLAGPDGEKALKGLLHRAPKTEERESAAKLYGANLTNPKTLHIQTVHSFCKDVLGALPFAAQTVGAQAILDDCDGARMLQAAQEEVVLRGEEPVLLEALATLLKSFSFAQIDDRLLAMVQKRYAFAEFVQRCIATPADEKAYEQYLRQLLLEAQQAPFDAAVAKGSARALLAAATGAEQEGLRAVERGAFEEAFLTAAGGLRKRLVSAALQRSYPNEVATLCEQAARFYAERNSQQSQDLIAQTQAFSRITKHVFDVYQAQKADVGCCDFEDLTMQMGALLQRAGAEAKTLAALWKQFPITHLLIDEAQDTSPQQWHIITQIVNTLFPKAERPTLFVVGDLKQSIYSFQGADPELFSVLEPVLHAAMERLGSPWRRINLQLSFRTTATVLEVVDSVFSTNSAGVTFQNGYLPHQAARKAEGFVEVMAINKKDKTDQMESIAEAAAGYIEENLRKNLFLPCVGRAATPDDFLILTRRRSELTRKVAERLQAVGVPTAGPDKMALQDCLVWKDLCALVHFLAFSCDDYNLACLLKSPFFDPPFSEQELFDCCVGRSGSVWAQVLALVPERIALLRQCLVEARTLASGAQMYVLFYRVLRHIAPRFRWAFGDLTDSVFEAFLKEIEVFCAISPPTVAGFDAFLKNRSLSVRPSGKNGVRFMTVHGAKGLQAPVVLLLDMAEPITLQKEFFAWIPREPFARDFLLLPPATLETKPAQRIRQEALRRQEEEDSRLFYVAMTRAQDGLCVMGVDKPGSWVGEVRRVLGELEYVGKKTFTAGEEKVEVLESADPEPEEAVPFLPAKRSVFTETSSPSQLSARGILLHAFVCALAAGGVTHSNSRVWAERTSAQLGFDFSEDVFGALKPLFEIANKKEFFYLQHGMHEAVFSENGVLFRLDHLYVGEKEAVIVEVKTAARVPAGWAEFLPAHQEQLRTYYRLVRAAFPQKNVRAMVLWTEAIRFTEIDPVDLING